MGLPSDLIGGLDAIAGGIGIGATGPAALVSIETYSDLSASLSLVTYLGPIPLGGLGEVIGCCKELSLSPKAPFSSAL